MRKKKITLKTIKEIDVIMSIRQSWHRKPVTRVKESKKIYNRKNKSYLND